MTRKHPQRSLRHHRWGLPGTVECTRSGGPTDRDFFRKFSPDAWHKLSGVACLHGAEV